VQSDSRFQRVTRDRALQRMQCPTARLRSVRVVNKPELLAQWDLQNRAAQLVHPLDTTYAVVERLTPQMQRSAFILAVLYR